MKKLLTLTLILCPAYCALHTVKPALAQSSGLSISPPVIEVLLAPNKKVVHAFQLTNQGDSTQFVANIHSLIPSDDHGHSTIDPTPLDPTTIPLILSLANADRELGEPFQLDSGDSTQLVLEIEGASTDITKDIYLALVISPVSPNTDNQIPSSIPSISSLILLTLSPDGIIPIKLSIDDFDLPPLHDSALPLTILAQLTNSADIMIRPHSTLLIESSRQTISDEITLDPNLILANSSRTLTQDSQPLTYIPKWYQIGPHNFTLDITTEGGSQIIAVTKTVWLLPIRALIIIFLLALFITSLLISARKRSQLSNS